MNNVCNQNLIRKTQTFICIFKESIYYSEHLFNSVYSKYIQDLCTTVELYGVVKSHLPWRA